MVWREPKITHFLSDNKNVFTLEVQQAVQIKGKFLCDVFCENLLEFPLGS